MDANQEQPAGVVLVVDDDRTMRTLIKAALNTFGSYRFHEAADGVEAQEILQAEYVDVVITDVKMPRMDGITLMRWARAQCPGPIWIINSGVGTFDAAVEAIDLGVFAFLSKPDTSFEALHLTVSNALERRRLIEDKERLMMDVAQTNLRLRQKVSQLENLCQLLYDQAEVIQRDLRRAQRIQRALLPHRPPVLQRFSVAALYRPCQHVGGDLYDIVRVDERHVVLFVADAAGHGIAAALLSVLFKQRLRMLDRQGFVRPPGAVLAGVSRALFEECDSRGLFVTAVYGVLDTVIGALSLAVAGHPPVLVQRADGSVDRIERTGPALGLKLDATFDERHVRIGPGDRLLAFTDGLHGDAHFTTDAIAEAFAASETRGLDLLYELLEQAEERAHALDEDDVTLVLVTARGGPSALDNGDDASSRARRPASTREPAAAEVLRGGLGETLTLVVRGRGSWVYGDPFYEEARAALEAGRTVVIDLSGCTYLDSTFLGTIHEVVAHADRTGAKAHIQGVSASVRQLFEEVSMTRVLEAVGPPITPIPESLWPLADARSDVVRSRRRILSAHDALVGLSERNRREFGAVVEALRAEHGAGGDGDGVG